MKTRTPASPKGAELLERYPKATYLGVAPLFMEPMIAPGSKNDWVIVPATGDPQIKLRTLHSPAFARRAVKELARSGAPVSVLYIAHEVPVGAAERVPKHGLEEELKTDPGMRNAALANRLDKVGRVVTKVVAPLAALPTMLAAGAVGLVGAGMDPAVLAAVAHSDQPTVGEPAEFFHIVSWI